MLVASSEMAAMYMLFSLVAVLVAPAYLTWRLGPDIRGIYHLNCRSMGPWESSLYVLSLNIWNLCVLNSSKGDKRLTSSCNSSPTVGAVPSWDLSLNRTCDRDWETKRTD